MLVMIDPASDGESCLVFYIRSLPWPTRAASRLSSSLMPVMINVAVILSMSDSATAKLPTRKQDVCSRTQESSRVSSRPCTVCRCHGVLIYFNTRYWLVWINVSPDPRQLCEHLDACDPVPPIVWQIRNDWDPRSEHALGGVPIVRHIGSLGLWDTPCEWPALFQNGILTLGGCAFFCLRGAICDNSWSTPANRESMVIATIQYNSAWKKVWFLATSISNYL